MNCSLHTHLISHFPRNQAEGFPFSITFRSFSRNLSDESFDLPTSKENSADYSVTPSPHYDGIFAGVFCTHEFHSFCFTYQFGCVGSSGKTIQFSRFVNLSLT